MRITFQSPRPALRTTAAWRLFIAALVACAALVMLAHWPHAQAITPQPAGPVDIRSAAVPLNPADASQDRVGRFVYAGGLALSAPQRFFGGLSDIDVMPDGRAVIVTDEAQQLELRIVLDAKGRLSSVAGARSRPLVGLDGRVLADKQVADAEGLAILPSGDRLVSFERQHRIWRYPAGGGVPVPAPAPEAVSAFPANAGLEALAALPGPGGTAYLTGSEGGTVWLCRLDNACRETALGTRVPAEFALTGISASPDGETLAILTRSFSPERGVRAVLRLVGRSAIDSASAPVLDELAISEPLTRDNFEGVALVNGPQPGVLRLYLLSDNNFSATQNTYLLAFDWKK